MTVPTTIKVPRFVGGGKIEWAEKPVPEPGPGELLVQVRANALCGSERGQFYHGSPGVTPGHEAAGVVALAGPGTQTPVGTPGAVFLMAYCGQCRSCRLGHTNQCQNKQGDMGFNRDGGYGPYERVPENVFFPVDPDLPLDQATLLLDIMGTGGHALARAQLLREDIESVLVAGAGPIGLGVLAMAKILLGQGVPVFVFDRVDYRLELARRLGGVPININEQSVEAALKEAGVGKADIALDTAGKTVARQACLSALGPRGALVCVGHGEGLELSVSPDLIAPERAVVGSEYFRFDELPANLVRLHEHRDYLAQIITHRFPVRDVQHAFETFFAGETGKVIVTQ